MQTRRVKMRRFLTGFAVAAWMAAASTLALGGNQEVADQIAQKLRADGQMSGYQIGVKCQAGTVWLQGTVTSEEQMNAALKVAFQTPGVARVVNQLSVGSAPAAPVANSAPAPQVNMGGPAPVAVGPAGRNPLRTQGLVPLSQNMRQAPKEGLLKRLETAVHRSEQNASTGVMQVPSSYRSAPVQTVSAQEEMPAEMVPAPQPVQRARPMPASRPATQPCPRGTNGAPMPMYTASANATGVAPARYDQPSLPNYAWPSYAAYPNYAAVTYPKQYSPTAWPYIGPFYPYPQVPLGWRKVTLEWDDGWWFLDFKDQPASCWQR
jgi:hypothetical protein